MIRIRTFIIGPEIYIATLFIFFLIDLQNNVPLKFGVVNFSFWTPLTVFWSA